MGSCNYLDIFYQNVQSLRTKSVDIFNNVCSLDFKIVCLTESWQNELFSSQHFFPPKFMLYIVLTEIILVNYVSEDILLLFLKQFFALNLDPTLNIFKTVSGYKLP
jgi:hypothetical protein